MTARTVERTVEILGIGTDHMLARDTVTNAVGELPFFQIEEIHSATTPDGVARKGDVATVTIPLALAAEQGML